MIMILNSFSKKSAIPSLSTVKVNIINGKYYCKDGHKRLSIIQDLLKNEEGYEKRRDVPYIIYNDGSSRSNDCWRDRKMH